MTVEEGHRNRSVEERTDIKYIVRTLHLTYGRCWQCSRERQINDWGVCRNCWRGWMDATRKRKIREARC